MLLLTGATGLIGSSVLRRLIVAGTPTRCLVRDPRGLGERRVRVQIALGDLADPPSFRNALRGVDTVVHLAGTVRDQSRGSIEELNGVATWRMVAAAERAGVRRFVTFSVLEASTYHRARLFRAKALAERAVREAELHSIVFAPSLVYAPGDHALRTLERLTLLPAVPMSGRGRAVVQPIWAEDVAECVIAALHASEHAPHGRSGEFARERYELAGPDTLNYSDIARLALRSFGRRRPLVHVPTPAVSRSLRALEAVAGERAPATWEEAELMEIDMVSRHGTADAEALGVAPRAMRAVLGVR
ncbi:MAG TPA: NAD(P)H-binding protein [Solirubrobacteraceae bacterium]|nr:NAD(P)H-binding protein [Solirubrobacteraceae bacterium]